MFRFVSVVLLAAGATLVAAQRPADDNAFPHTKPNGRATVEYRDEKVQAVAIYDYSQRNHDTAWILVQIGVALAERGAVRRDSFSVVMAGGRSVPLATQEQFLADSQVITKLRQNARIFQREVISYFPKSADGEFIRWFALPGEGTVRNPAIVPSEHGVVIGDLYFRSPTLRWETGTHRLVFDNDKGHAELPIRLE
ncbi:MAG TPA: hypothetical protein VFO31_13920 [Vicinamibacterales bacterium]|nr:hypothetical protein [Vicinamibacterales bacterium]